jgi:hypothetical protein
LWVISELITLLRWTNCEEALFMCFGLQLLVLCIQRMRRFGCLGEHGVNSSFFLFTGFVVACITFSIYLAVVVLYCKCLLSCFLVLVYGKILSCCQFLSRNQFVDLLCVTSLFCRLLLNQVFFVSWLHVAFAMSCSTLCDSMFQIPIVLNNNFDVVSSCLHTLKFLALMQRLGPPLITRMIRLRGWIKTSFSFCKSDLLNRKIFIASFLHTHGNEVRHLNLWAAQ